MEFASNELWAGLRGQLFGRFKHRLRKVPGMGSGRGMQQESCLHAEGKGQHTCTQLHTHTHMFRFYILCCILLIYFIYIVDLVDTSCHQRWDIWISSKWTAPGVCQLLSICETGDGWMQRMGSLGRMRSESRIHAAEVRFHMRPFEAGHRKGVTSVTSCTILKM